MSVESPDVPEPQVDEAFDRVVEEGKVRLARTTASPSTATSSHQKPPL